MRGRQSYSRWRDGATVPGECLVDKGTEWGVTGEKASVRRKSVSLQSNQGMITRWEGRETGTRGTAGVMEGIMQS